MVRKRKHPAASRRKSPRKISSTAPGIKARKVSRPATTKIRPRKADPRLEAALLEMNRGRSLTAAARDAQVSRGRVQRFLLQRRLGKRKGQRWTTRDTRPRRVPVMTGGRFRVLTVRGYDQARLVGKHHSAVGEFVRTNNLGLIKPFKDQAVQTVSGRKYPLETSPNALHRIAAMDSPPFHEIYEITSNT